MAFLKENRFTVRILAAVARARGFHGPPRTKAALAAAKARGGRLGGQRGSPDRMEAMARKGNAASATVRRAASAKRNEDLLPVIEDMHTSGAVPPQQIADGLNERGITAARGGAWSAVQVRRILESSTAFAVDSSRDRKSQNLQSLYEFSIAPCPPSGYSFRNLNTYPPLRSKDSCGYD